MKQNKLEKHFGENKMEKRVSSYGLVCSLVTLPCAVRRNQETYASVIVPYLQ